MIKEHIFSEMSDEALEIYRDFSGKEGARHIAKPTSIEAMKILLKKYKPTTILEVGGGIGTLSFVCLKYSDAHVDIFEDDKFCIEELKKNLKGFEERYTVYSNYHDYLLPRESYNLVVFDGGTYQLIDKLVRGLNNIDTVYFEGSRVNDRAVFRNAAREKYVLGVTEYIDGDRKYKGGHEILCRNSRSKILRQLAYFYWEVVYYIRNVAINGVRRRIKRVKNLFA